MAVLEHDLDDRAVADREGVDGAELVFEHGHLWRRRRTTVPIGSVAALQTNAIGLALTKDEFGKLPSEKA